jgi:hypothetical protein
LKKGRKRKKKEGSVFGRQGDAPPLCRKRGTDGFTGKSTIARARRLGLEGDDTSP